MAIPKEVLDEYLNKPMPYLPRFKRADRAQLERIIYNCTGALLRTKTAPRTHQLEGLAFALYLRRALLYYDPQLGKTWIALNWAEHLLRSGLWREGKGLVIAHSPLGLDVWETQAREHSHLRIRTVHTSWADFCDALESDCALIVCPWSGLQEIFTETTRANTLRIRVDMLRDVAEYLGLCIIDEIHMAKDPETLRFSIAAQLTRLCKFRVGLTGTPFSRDPFGLWAQAYLMDRGHTLGRNFLFFQQAFGERKTNWYTGKREYKFEKSKMPMLNYKLHTLALPYPRSECMDDVVYTGAVRLRMREDQLRAYEDALQNIIRLRTGEAIKIPNMFHRLRQIGSGYLPWNDDETDEKNIVHFRSNPKLRWLEEFVVALENDVTIIIFHEYIHTGLLIHRMLDRVKVPHGWLYGGVSAKRSSDMVRDFQQGRIRTLVSNAVKGGVSISLPMADYVLFFESPTSVIIRKQAESRPMARGSRPLVIDDLVASSADEKVLEFIAEGKDLMASLAKELPKLARGGRSSRR